MRALLFLLGACASVPEPAAPAPAARTTVITLGTRGGPMPTAGRAQSSNLLVVDDALYLVDAGDNVTRRIVQAGYDFRRIDRVFLTHLHGDHTAGLATLVGAAWDYNRTTPIEIYGSGVDRLVAGTIAYLTPNAEIRASMGRAHPLAGTVAAREIVPGLIYEDAKVKVTAVENTHFQFAPGTPPHGVYRSYSYRFETPDRVVVFAGDTGPSDALQALAKDADVLVTEVGDPDAVIALARRSGAWQRKTPEEQAGQLRHLRDEHLPAATIGQLAAAANVKLVVMTHLVTTVDLDDDYQRYIADARVFYAGPIVIAKDLQRF